MNLFLLALDVKQCAEKHADVHVVKMPLEATQMLVTAWHCARVPFVWTFLPYKATHVNHPCAIWIRSDPAHYHWALQYGLSLCKEYTKRYGKVHACEYVLSSLSNMGPPPTNEHQKVPRYGTSGIPSTVQSFPICINEDVLTQCIVSHGERVRDVQKLLQMEGSVWNANVVEQEKEMLHRNGAQLAHCVKPIFPLLKKRLHC
jgi:hypothetical protein